MKTTLINAGFLAYILGLIVYGLIGITSKPETVILETEDKPCRHFYEYRVGEFHKNHDDWCG